jgi:hypothetical protein
MWPPIVWSRGTNVSEEYAAFIFRVEEVYLEVEVAGSSETLVPMYEITRRLIPENHNLNSNIFYNQINDESDNNDSVMITTTERTWTTLQLRRLRDVE